MFCEGPDVGVIEREGLVEARIDAEVRGGPGHEAGENCKADDQRRAPAKEPSGEFLDHGRAAGEPASNVVAPASPRARMRPSGSSMRAEMAVVIGTFRAVTVCA